MVRNTNVLLTDSGENGTISEDEKYWLSGYYKASIELKEVEKLFENDKHDFALLVQLENRVVYLIVMCNNNDYLVDCISDQLGRLDNTCKTYNISFFDELFNFKELKENGSKLSIFDDANADYISYLKRVCARIDEMKETIASRINSCRYEKSIAEKRRTIKDCKDVLNKYFGYHF